MPSATSLCHAALVLKVLFHLLTLVAAFGWLRFADLRKHCLSRPSAHHQVWLRVLISLSVASMTCLVASAACDLGALRG